MTQKLPWAAWLMFGASALSGCGGSGSGSAADQVRAAVVGSVRLPDKATCLNDFTASGIMAYYRQDTAAAARRDCEAEAGRALNEQRAKDLKVSGIAISGDHATANAELKGRRAVYSLVKQGAWKVSGIREAGASSSTPSTATSATTTSTVTTSSGGSSVNTNRLALEVAARQYNVASRRFGSRVMADTKAKSLDAVKGDAAQFRDAVFAFDASVRKITPAPSSAQAYNALLAADRTAIADLDAIGAASAAHGVGRLFRTRLVPDTQMLVRAEAQLYDAL